MTALWRVSRHCDLEGLGGEKAHGRWHEAAPGKRIVYLSEHPAVALIEALANLRGDPRFFPESYQLIKVVVADNVFRPTLGSTLSTKWRGRVAETRFLGDAWLEEGSSALLAVPSAPSPESWNYLLNPLHPDAAGLKIEWCRWIAYDKRLFQV